MKICDVRVGRRSQVCDDRLYGRYVMAGSIQDLCMGSTMTGYTGDLITG